MSLIIFSCLNVRGSGLPDSSFIWTIKYISWGACESVSSYMIKGDTLIEDKVYKQIYTVPDSIYSEESSLYYCAARDSSGKWYFIPGGNSIEYLLYDFNASVGDVIKVNNPWSVGEAEAHVISKDSVLIEGEYKTRIGIGARPGELWEYWIEDIGCESGLFYSCFYIFDIGYRLTCTYKNNDFYSNFGFNEYCGCGPNTLIEEEINDVPISIYPNPSFGTINIQNQKNLSVKIYFYSIDGKRIGFLKLNENAFNQIRFNYKGVIIVRIEGDGIHSTQRISLIE